MQYAINRTGPMTMAASLGTAFLKTDERLETPDIQFHIQPFSANNAVEGPHKFFSFRGEHGICGRFGAVIGVR